MRSAAFSFHALSIARRARKPPDTATKSASVVVRIAQRRRLAIIRRLYIQ